MPDLGQVVGAYRNDGGYKAKGGFYWNKYDWKIEVVRGEEGILPGSKDDYKKIPTLAMLVAAPVMGGLFVVFLPFVGTYMVVGHGAKKAMAGVRDASTELASAIGPRWQPGEAYFGFRKTKKKDEKKPEPLEKKLEDTNLEKGADQNYH